MCKPRVEKVRCKGLYQSDIRNHLTRGISLGFECRVSTSLPSGYCKRHDPDRKAARKATSVVAAAAGRATRLKAEWARHAIAHADAAIVAAALDESEACVPARLANAVRARRALGTGDAP